MIFVNNVPLNVEIEEVLDDLQSLTGYPKRIKNTGDNFMVTCPFHADGNERNASCGISKYEFTRNGHTYESGTVHCYACGYKSNLSKFVADLLDYSYEHEGFAWLTNRYYTVAEGSKRTFSLNFERAEQKNETKMYDFLPFRQLLDSTSDYESYLQTRKLSKEVAEIFQLGFDDFRKTLVIPLFDTKGNCIGIKERSVVGKAFYNTEDIEKSSVVFGLYQLKQQEVPLHTKIWVCESEIDCMTAWSWGECAVAFMGSHMSREQQKILLNSGYTNFVDGFDRDTMGRKGWQSFKNDVLSKGSRTFNVLWTSNAKDINELTEDEFRNLIIQ